MPRALRAQPLSESRCPMSAAESLCQSGEEWAESSVAASLETRRRSGSTPTSIPWLRLGQSLSALAREDWRACQLVAGDMLAIARPLSAREGPRGAASLIGSAAALLAECSRAEEAGEAAMPHWTFEDHKHPLFWAGQAASGTQSGYAWTGDGWTGLAGPAAQGPAQAAWAHGLMALAKGWRHAPDWHGRPASAQARELAERWGLRANDALSANEAEMIGAAFTRLRLDFEIGISNGAPDGACPPRGARARL